MTTWITMGKAEDLGFLPAFIDDNDQRPAREQLKENYAHGGGWRPMSGWIRMGTVITYPGDPPMRPIAMTKLRDETLYLYPHAFLMILQKDGSFEVSRVD